MGSGDQEWLGQISCFSYCVLLLYLDKDIRANLIAKAYKNI